MMADTFAGDPVVAVKVDDAVTLQDESKSTSEIVDSINVDLSETHNVCETISNNDDIVMSQSSVSFMSHNTPDTLHKIPSQAAITASSYLYDMKVSKHRRGSVSHHLDGNPCVDKKKGGRRVSFLPEPSGMNQSVTDDSSATVISPGNEELTMTPIDNIGMYPSGSVIDTSQLQHATTKFPKTPSSGAPLPPQSSLFFSKSISNISQRGPMISSSGNPTTDGIDYFQKSASAISFRPGLRSAVGGGAPKPVFLSYCRRNKDMAVAIHESLTEKGSDAWTDWIDIAKGEDWWFSIRRGISRSSAFMFLLSGHSLLSKVCQDELLYALSLNKRIVPVVLDELNDPTTGIKLEIPESLGKLNWVFCRLDEGDDLHCATNEIAEAILWDLDLVEEHTLFLVKAMDWRRECQRAEREHSHIAKHTFPGIGICIRDGALAPQSENDMEGGSIDQSYSKVLSCCAVDSSSSEEPRRANRLPHKNTNEITNPPESVGSDAKSGISGITDKTSYLESSFDSHASSSWLNYAKFAKHLLLSGKDLEKVDTFINCCSTKGEPLPTNLHLLYFNESKLASKVKSRKFMFALVIGMFVAAALCIAAVAAFIVAAIANNNANSETLKAKNCQIASDTAADVANVYYYGLYLSKINTGMCLGYLALNEAIERNNAGIFSPTQTLTSQSYSAALSQLPYYPFGSSIIDDGRISLWPSISSISVSSKYTFQQALSFASMPWSTTYKFGALLNGDTSHYLWYNPANFTSNVYPFAQRLPYGDASQSVPNNVKLLATGRTMLRADTMNRIGLVAFEDDVPTKSFGSIKLTSSTWRSSAPASEILTLTPINVFDRSSVLGFSGDGNTLVAVYAGDIPTLTGAILYIWDVTSVNVVMSQSQSVNGITVASAVSLSFSSSATTGCGQANGVTVSPGGQYIVLTSYGGLELGLILNEMLYMCIFKSGRTVDSSGVVKFNPSLWKRFRLPTVSGEKQPSGSYSAAFSPAADRLYVSAWPYSVYVYAMTDIAAVLGDQAPVPLYALAEFSIFDPMLDNPLIISLSYDGLFMAGTANDIEVRLWTIPASSTRTDYTITLSIPSVTIKAYLPYKLQSQPSRAVILPSQLHDNQHCYIATTVAFDPNYGITKGISGNLAWPVELAVGCRSGNIRLIFPGWRIASTSIAESLAYLKVAFLGSYAAALQETNGVTPEAIINAASSCVT